MGWCTKSTFTATTTIYIFLHNIITKLVLVQCGWLCNCRTNSIVAAKLFGILWRKLTTQNANALSVVVVVGVPCTTLANGIGTTPAEKHYGMVHIVYHRPIIDKIPIIIWNEH